MRTHIARVVYLLMLAGALTSAYAQESRVLLNSQNLKVEIKPAPETMEIIISSAQQLPKASIFDLSDPARTVIDLPGVNTAVSRQFSTPDSNLIKGLRLGSHPDKLRIVIDRIENKELYLVRQQTQKSLLLTYSLKAPPDVPPAKAAEETATPQATPTAIETPTPAPSRKPTRTPSQTPTATPTPTSSATATASPTTAASAASTPPGRPSEVPETEAIPLASAAATPDSSSAPQEILEEVNSDQRRLLAYLFNYADNGDGTRKPVLELALSDRGEYRFAKRGEREFVVTLPKTIMVAEYLSLPHFPPRDFVGVDAVQAKKIDQGIEVVVLAERGHRLTAAAVGNSIVLRPQPWP